MIQISDKQNCCGCEACVQICPKHCISFTPDNEGFSYPKVDETICINCGLCEKVCPVQHPYEVIKPLKTLAAINKNDEVRMASSSGGIFTLLAEQVIDKGGVVFGARFDNKWQVVFDYAETKEDLKAFRNSKYVQAHIGNSFLRCKEFLDVGRNVLFSGSPCQIAGLHSFLHKDYENLLAVDFICHGVPSPLVWNLYLTDILAEASSSIQGNKCRKKSRSKTKDSFVLDFNDDGQEILMHAPFSENMYLQAFIKNLFLRPSCHACPSKSGKSHSDITIADFWGIQMINPQMDDNRGTSLVMINSEKGSSVLPYEMMKFTEEEFEQGISYNSAWLKSVAPHFRRTEFFDDLSKNKNVTKLITRALRPTMCQRFLLLKHPLALAKMILLSIWGGYFLY